MTVTAPKDLRAARAKVFISYSRKDLPFAERLVAALIEHGFEADLAKRDILPGEPWQERLGKLIAGSDTVVFVLSPDSVASAVCAWEVNEAERLSKRLRPVVFRTPSDEAVPGRLKRLNYVFLRSDAEWKSELSGLVDALLIDIAWIREHTRLSELATRWLERRTRTTHRAEPLLLRGSALAEAELWLSQRSAAGPDPTEAHRTFIVESRRSEQAALKRSRRRNRVVALFSLAAAAVMGALGWFFLQWRESQITQSRFLGDLAAQHAANGDGTTGMLLALEALPDSGSDNPVQRWRPYAPEAERGLSLRAFRGR